MSTQNRRLSYFSIDFLQDERHFFIPNLFCEFIDYLNLLSSEEKIVNDIIQKKAASISNIICEKKQSMLFYKIVFKSCKYNHSPEYMSSRDGSERPSDKQLDEGEKELTHMCMRIDPNEAYTIFEERRNGVSIGNVVKYFNTLLKKFLEQKGVLDKFIIWSSIIPPDDFLSSLKKANRITVANIFVDKEVLGDDYLGLMNVDASSQEELIMALKAKRMESLPKRAIEQTFTKLSTAGTVVKRIRLYGKDINKLNVVIDSLNQKKVEEVVVDLKADGTVDSYSIFARIEEILGVTE